MIGMREYICCCSVHEALGFSPFELAFGHVLCGPLKLLKEAWLTVDSLEDIITQVSDVCHRLLKATEFARKNLQLTQGNMKIWYDKKAHKTLFKPDNKVLVLLPIHGHPLQTHYCGPFVVEKRVSEVDYVIKTPGCCKDNRLCHMNILKGYQEGEDVAESESKVVSVVAMATPCLQSSLQKQSTRTLLSWGCCQGAE